MQGENTGCSLMVYYVYTDKTTKQIVMADMRLSNSSLFASLTAKLIL